MSRRAVFMLGLSVAAHAAFLGRWLTAPAPLPPPLPVAKIAGVAIDRVAIAAARGRVAAARRELVRKAREELARGELALGEFLIAASAIDAGELHRALDVATARARYADRLVALRARLAREPLRDAVPGAFADFRYKGRPGGTVGEALLERGGSCEPLSQLVAAAAFDLGRGAEVALRFYGGGVGATHLAPVALAPHGAEWDLATGKAAHPGGSRFSPDELVEIYARAHGVDARAEAASGGGGESGSEDVVEAPAVETMAPGYPPNDAVFPGGVPLFATRAFAPRVEAAASDLPAIDGADMARECAAFVGIGVLDPPTVTLAGGAEIEVRPLPRPAELDRKSSWIQGVEQFLVRRDSDAADALMSLACVASLGDTAAIDFDLAGDRDLARAAEEKATRARHDGGRRLAAIAWEAEEGAVLRVRIAERYPGRAWLLAALPGGGDVALAVLRDAPSDDPASSLAALVVAPATRRRAIAQTSRLARSDQVAVMRAIFSADANLAPWMPNHGLDADPDDVAGAPFRGVYAVYRGLAFRTFSGARPIDETIAAFDREADRHAIDDAWRATLLADYGQNALAFAASRPDGMQVVFALDRALSRRKHPILAPFVRMLREIEAMGRIDPESLPATLIR